MKKTNKKQEPQTQISVSEFKSWMSGVEDMQDAGWVPTPEQWLKIRQKIYALQEPTATQQFLVEQAEVQHLHAQNAKIQFTSPVHQPQHSSHAGWAANVDVGVNLPAQPVPLYSEIDLMATIDNGTGYVSPLT